MVVVAQSLRVEIDVANKKKAPTCEKYSVVSQQINKSRAQEKTIIESIPKCKKRHREHNKPTKKYFASLFVKRYEMSRTKILRLYSHCCLNECREYWQLWNFKWKSTCERSVRFSLLHQHFSRQSKNPQNYFMRMSCVNVIPSPRRHQCGAVHN